MTGLRVPIAPPVDMATPAIRLRQQGNIRNPHDHVGGRPVVPALTTIPER